MILDFGYLCMTFQLNLSDSLAFPCHIQSKEMHTYAGGNATNQAICAARSGAKVALIGTIGTDIFGKKILSTLRREGINTSGIAKSEIPTGIIHSIIDNKNQKAIISSAGANQEISPDQIPTNMLNERALILLQHDVSIDINTEVLKRARAQKAQSILCLSHESNIDGSMFDNLDIAIIAEEILPYLCDKLSIPLENFSASLAKKKNIHCIIAKNSGLSGAYATSKNSKHYEQGITDNTFSVNHTETFNSFCGTFTACIQAGLNLPRAMQYATSAASLTSQSDTFPYLGDIEENIT
ncbi:MAG: hypothetical protein COA45_00995 [Zetaproteobacteria bacterium]|nr:MAG: hypothetical protein COA45_00995 [Zetaproteobacteria bacterium]